MVTRWYALRSNGIFYVSTDGEPVWNFTLGQMMKHIPEAYSYITQHAARKHNDPRFSKDLRQRVYDDCPF